MSIDAVFGRESDKFVSNSEFFEVDIFFSGSGTAVKGHETFPCGLASGTSRLKSPPTHPQGKTNFNGNTALRYPGKIAHFSFSLIALMTLSATTFGSKVGTHLK